MRKAGRSNLNLAFERLNGQSPNDEQIRRMRDIGDALGVSDNDAVWLMIMLHEHQMSELRNASALAAESRKKNEGRSYVAAGAITEAEMQKRLTKEAEVIASLAKDVARATAGRSYLQWAIAAAIVALASLSVAGWLGWYSGHKAGHAEGYAETQDERANASWGNSAQGKKSRRLAEAGSLDLLADCSGPGWYTVGDKCMPAKSRKVGTFGWRLH